MSDWRSKLASLCVHLEDRWDEYMDGEIIVREQVCCSCNFVLQRVTEEIVVDRISSTSIEKKSQIDGIKEAEINDRTDSNDSD